jgi:GTPase SAR1 family protein
MIVGQENVGKTSIAKCLKQMGAKLPKPNRAPVTVSTDGIDIDDWIPITGEASAVNSEKSPLRFNVWDFAGQEVYVLNFSLTSFTSFIKSVLTYCLFFPVITTPTSSF